MKTFRKHDARESNWQEKQNFLNGFRSGETTVIQDHIFVVTPFQEMIFPQFQSIKDRLEQISISGKDSSSIQKPISLGPVISSATLPMRLIDCMDIIPSM